MLYLFYFLLFPFFQAKLFNCCFVRKANAEEKIYFSFALVFYGEISIRCLKKLEVAEPATMLILSRNDETKPFSISFNRSKGWSEKVNDFVSSFGKLGFVMKFNMIPATWLWTFSTFPQCFHHISFVAFRQSRAKRSLLRADKFISAQETIKHNYCNGEGTKLLCSLSTEKHRSTKTYYFL